MIRIRLYALIISLGTENLVYSYDGLGKKLMKTLVSWA